MALSPRHAAGQLRRRPRSKALAVSLTPPESVSPVSEATANRRRLLRRFLEEGIPILASAGVADAALVRTGEIVGHLLAGRRDIIGAMVKRGTRLIVIGKDQVYTDMPEYRNSPNPAYQNERVCGLKSRDQLGEENLLNLAGDRYDDESIAVHEFCHTIDAALGTIDPEWRQRHRQNYQGAVAFGLWKNAYATTNPGDYWARSASPTSTATGSTTGITPRSARARLRGTTPKAMTWSGRPSG